MKALSAITTGFSDPGAATEMTGDFPRGWMALIKKLACLSGKAKGAECRKHVLRAKTKLYDHATQDLCSLEK
jgi:hypothetical protein